MTSERSEGARTEVKHRTFGRGQVVGRRRRGAELLVQFRTVKVWLPARELGLEEPPPAKVPQRPAPKDDRRKSPAPRPAAPTDHSQLRKSRQIVEALRLGVVPLSCIADFTFGRDSEIGMFQTEVQRFAREGAGLLIVEGEYGEGKSHFLDFVSECALDAGCAVMRADLDPFEVPPSKPKRVYGALSPSLRYRGAGGQERDIIGLMAEASKTMKRIDHDFIDVALSASKRFAPGSEGFETLWEWFRGEDVPRWYLTGYSGLPIYLPSMYTYMTAADLYCYLLSGLGHVMRGLGRPGILIIMDEAETATRLWSTYYRQRADNFLEGLVRLALNDASLLGFSSGLQHNGMNPYRFMFKNPSGVFFLMAVTPSWEVDHLFNRVLPDAARDSIIQLGDIDDKARSKMLSETIRHYAACYPGFRWPPGIALESVEHLVDGVDNVRTMVRRFVGALDAVRYRPDGDGQELFKLA